MYIIAMNAAKSLQPSVKSGVSCFAQEDVLLLIILKAGG